jgi:hypothetical protein
VPAWSPYFLSDNPQMDKHEDYSVHKLAKLLHLSHQQLIEAKLKTLRRQDSP